MTFAHPRLLWLIAILVPALMLFFWWSWRVRNRLISLFVPRRLQAALTVGLSPRRVRFRAFLLLLALTALLLALARPRYGSGTTEVTQRGLNILVAVDTSRSMLAEDAGPGTSRLRRAKLAALDLARLARTDRLGLIAFAGSAFLQCPLTIDDEAFRQTVELLDTEIIPEGGTAIGPAIRAALDAFRKEKENLKVLVLFTDGEEHEQGALDAAKDAASSGLRIFPIGVGTTRGEILRIRDENGNESYVKDDQGNVVKSSLNESLLREIAQITGGFYLPLQGARAMSELYERGLEPLPRTERASREIEQFHERYQWPLALAILLLAIEAMIPERARPRGQPRAARLPHPALATSAAACILLLSNLDASASATAALRQYQSGRFTAAQEEYERLAQEHPNDARLRFNAGTAAYRAENYPRAIAHFTDTLRTSDLGLQHDAYYNLGNAQFFEGESVQDPAARRHLWEQSVQSLEAALTLNPNDPNALHNRDYIRKRLEELKEQESKQPDQSEKKDQSDDQSDQSDQSDATDESQEPQQKPEQSRSSDQPEQSDQKQDSQQPDEQPSPQNQEKPGPSSESENKPADPSQPNANPTGADPNQAMTVEQALRLLDAAKGEEKPIPLEKRRARGRVIKNW